MQLLFWKSPALFVALRYFGDNTFLGLLKGKPLNFIQLLTGITVFVILSVTAVLVILLSVFNGLEGFTRSIYSTYTPEIKISPRKGKSFVLSADTMELIRQMEGVAVLTGVVEDQALLLYGGEGPEVVSIKGMENNYAAQYRMDTAVVKGSAALFDEAGAAQAMLGLGVQYNMGIDLDNAFVSLQFWYPRQDHQASLDPRRAFRKQFIAPGGVFRLGDPAFNYRYVIVPLTFARSLMNYTEQQYTHLELRTTDDARPWQVKRNLRKLLGDALAVEDSDEQHKTILQAIKIERFFVFMGASLVIAIASFNIFFALAMMAIDKRTDIELFFALGAGRGFVRGAFLWTGTLMGLLGTGLGLLLGVVLCYLQDVYGLAKLGSANSPIGTIPYPIAIHWQDFALTGLVVLSITILASVFPATNASRVGGKASIVK